MACNIFHDINLSSKENARMLECLQLIYRPQNAIQN